MRDESLDTLHYLFSFFPRAFIYLPPPPLPLFAILKLPGIEKIPTKFRQQFFLEGEGTLSINL